MKAFKFMCSSCDGSGKGNGNKGVCKFCFGWGFRVAYNEKLYYPIDPEGAFAFGEPCKMEEVRASEEIEVREGYIDRHGLHTKTHTPEGYVLMHRVRPQGEYLGKYWGSYDTDQAPMEEFNLAKRGGFPPIVFAKDEEE